MIFSHFVCSPLSFIASSRKSTERLTLSSSPFSQAAASPSLPFLILGFGSLLGAAVSVLLPETADVDLPDTVEEARAFGRGQSVWRMPCIERRKKEKRELIEEKGKEAAAKENGNA